MIGPLCPCPQRDGSTSMSPRASWQAASRTPAGVRNDERGQRSAYGLEREREEGESGDVGKRNQLALFAHGEVLQHLLKVVDGEEDGGVCLGHFIIFHVHSHLHRNIGMSRTR